MEFEVCFEEFRDCIIANNNSKDIACYSSCGITVAFMIDRGNHSFLQTIEVLNRTVDCNGKSFFSNPTFTNCFNIFHIRHR